MSARTALAGAATTALVVAGVGNPAVVEATRTSDHQELVATIVGFVDWDLADARGEVVGLVAIRLGVLVVVAALLCGLVGRSRSRVAAWLGGWGAVGIAAAIAGAAAYVYEVPVVLDGDAPAPTYVDGIVQAVNSGAAYGLWTGWLVGAVVALLTRTAPATAVEPATVAATGAPPTDPSESPPPWWAPTYAGDAGVRPGPTAFPPSGLGRPVVAGAGEPVVPVAPPAPAPDTAAPPVTDGVSHHLSTASGDPHPSDPDATRPVGMPPDLDAGPDTSDSDATTTMPADGPAADPTAQMPRPPER